MLRWVNVWRLKNLAGILTVCWESARSELIALLSRLARTLIMCPQAVTEVRSDDPKNEFDA